MTEKRFTTSDKLVRRPFDVPETTARLLKAAGIEHRAPEDIVGLLFGCIAHLAVGVFTQFPEHWPVFRAAFLEASDDLRDVFTSTDPSIVVAGVMERQKRDRAVLKRQQAVGAVATPVEHG